MLLPRMRSEDGAEEDDPRAELVRRLQEYERFKKAAEDIDGLQRLERDTLGVSAEVVDRKVVKLHPDVTLKEMLLAFKDVVQRAQMFNHHHVQRERLSVRQRMADVLAMLKESAFVQFGALFKPEEGKMGVTVTFIAILELMKEALIEIVQTEPYAPIHIRPAGATRRLNVVTNDSSDAENEAALAQPAQPDENEIDDEVAMTVADDSMAPPSAEVQNETVAVQDSHADDVSSDDADADSASDPDDADLTSGSDDRKEST
jgi:segregation and condensation protein A